LPEGEHVAQVTPGAPGSIRDYTARRALVAANRRRNRYAPRTSFPFRYGDVVVTRAAAHHPFGRSTHARGYLTHIVDSLFIAWRRGQPIEAGARWRCGAMGHYFTMMDEPTSPVCPACTIERVSRP
jgi:hypothetical protein